MSEKHVLIVEDEPDQAAALARVLALKQLTCEVAGTLALALARLKTDDIGCIVLDLTLPDATGTVGVAALVEQFPIIPVVVLTGYPDCEAEAIGAGAQEVIVKPGHPDDLLRAIRTAVERHKVRSEYRPYTRALKAAADTLGELADGVPENGV